MEDEHVHPIEAMLHVLPHIKLVVELLQQTDVPCIAPA